MTQIIIEYGKSLFHDYTLHYKKTLIFIKDFLNKTNFTFYAALFIVIYSIAGICELIRYDWNPFVFFRFGHFYIEQNPNWTPDGVIRFLGNEQNGGNGYDGQIFYYFSRSLIETKEWPQGFSMAYRAPRLGLPLINFPFGFFGNLTLAWGFILTQFSLVLLSVFYLHKHLQKASKYLTLFYIMSPFLLRSTLLMVSDGTTISLAIIAYYFFERVKENKFYPILTCLLFSLSLLAKESALFILFPLGLYSLYKKELTKIILILTTLLPLIIWQYYLRTTHGMVPANILKIFISPFNGIFFVIQESINIFQGDHSIKQIIILQLKNSAKLLLIMILCAATYSSVKGKWKDNWHFRLMSLFTIISIIFADYFYFWGIFDNVARMFGIIVPAIILLKSNYPSAKTQSFFTALVILLIMVLLRAILLTPTFPHDNYSIYQGPSYRIDPSQP